MNLTNADLAILFIKVSQLDNDDNQVAADQARKLVSDHQNTPLVAG